MSFHSPAPRISRIMSRRNERLKRIETPDAEVRGCSTMGSSVRRPGFDPDNARGRRRPLG